MFAVAAVLLSWLVHGYARGFIQGVLLTAFLSLVLTAFHTITGAHRTISGAWGEDNTRDALKRAKRRRLISGWVDNLETQSGDVDHLVITRSGEVLALDSKWHADTDPTACARDTEAAWRASRKARLILKSLGYDVPVRPVVVIWGGAQSDLPAGHLVVGGIDVVKGSELVPWLKQFSSPIGDTSQLRVLHNELSAFRLRVQPDRRFA